MGPVTGNELSGAGLGQNMPNVPLTLWLGGVQAPVVYQGRSGCCFGEDQIVFKVPNNVPTGCAVPLVVQIGTATNTISNTTVMPVANGSRNCTPSNVALASVDVEQAVMAGPVTYSEISLIKNLNSSGNGYLDQAKFEFTKILTYNPGTQPFFMSWIDDQPVGACIVFNNLNSDTNSPKASTADLDGGSSFTVKGPNGSVPVTGTPWAIQGNAQRGWHVSGPRSLYRHRGRRKGCWPFQCNSYIPRNANVGQPAVLLQPCRDPFQRNDGHLGGRRPER